MVSTVHRRAVTRMLRATGLARVGSEAPLVELVKELARQMDADGGSTRVQASYLSALKDVRKAVDEQRARAERMTERAQGEARQGDGEDESGSVPPPTALDKFRDKHLGAA
jgi:hypothetical protein